ncbi:MAG: TolC family protein [Calditrichota bacterium]
MQLARVKRLTFGLILIAASLRAADPTPHINPIDDENSKSDTLHLTLSDAILTALQNNPTVTIQRLGVDIAARQIEGEKSVFYPELSASASQSKTDAERRVGSLREPVSITDERTSYAVGLSESLPTGTNISAEMTIDGSISSLYSDQYSGHAGITITQALLQGMGLGANGAALRQAEVDNQWNQTELDAVAEQVVAEVEQTYWNLYLARQTIRIREESLQLSERQVEETRQRIAVGRLAELEMAAAEAELALRRVALLDAQQNLNRVELDLLCLLNISADGGWRTTIQPVDEPLTPSDSLAPLEQWLELAKLFRSDLIQARLELKKSQITIIRTRNGLLPKLDLFLTLGRTSYAEAVKESFPQLDSPYHDVSAGVSLTLPLPYNRSHTEYKQALLTKSQRDLMLNNLERLMERDVRKAYLESRLAYKRIDATRIARILQERNWEAETEKFRVGKSTNLQVALVQNNLAEARLEEERTRVTYLNSITAVYLNAGTLLERRGIRK